MLIRNIIHVSVRLRRTENFYSPSLAFLGQSTYPSTVQLIRDVMCILCLCIFKHASTYSTPAWTFFFLFTVLCVLLAFVIQRGQRNRRLPPGPFTIPLVGYLPFYGTNLHEAFSKLARTYGPVVRWVISVSVSIPMLKLNLLFMDNGSILVQVYRWRCGRLYNEIM